jgi:GntR family transcriptional regulator, rspAB operon transcriptional repressor
MRLLGRGFAPIVHDETPFSLGGKSDRRPPLRGTLDSNIIIRLYKSAMSKRQPARPKGLRRELVHQAIRSMLIAGEFRPGRTLSELDLAARFRTSRTPVREAIMRLCEEGMVEIVPHRGPVVRVLSQQDITELFAVREALEGLVARLVTSRISAAELKDLREEWEELASGVSESTLDAVFTKSSEFHLAITEAARSPLLSKLLASIRGLIESSRYMYLRPDGHRSVKRALRACEEHLLLIDAFAAGDPSKSERIMKQHLRWLVEEMFDTNVGEFCC